MYNFNVAQKLYIKSFDHNCLYYAEVILFYMWLICDEWGRIRFIEDGKRIESFLVKNKKEDYRNYHYPINECDLVCDEEKRLYAALIEIEQRGRDGKTFCEHFLNLYEEKGFDAYIAFLVNHHKRMEALHELIDAFFFNARINDVDTALSDMRYEILNNLLSQYLILVKPSHFNFVPLTEEVIKDGGNMHPGNVKTFLELDKETFTLFDNPSSTAFQLALMGPEIWFMGFQRFRTY